MSRRISHYEENDIIHPDCGHHALMRNRIPGKGVYRALHRKEMLGGRHCHIRQEQLLEESLQTAGNEKTERVDAILSNGTILLPLMYLDRLRIPGRTSVIKTI